MLPSAAYKLTRAGCPGVGTKSKGRAMLAAKTTVLLRIALSIAALGTTGFAVAQTQPPTDAEKKMADTIKCEDFTELPNGNWKSGPNARVGNMTFADSVFGPNGLVVGGADLYVVVNRKCGGQPL
jgi:hypothetical protein